ncbi:hypothetical protein BD413DRAFT_169275 [Trametes elegans]|nr:hypothetical protein BD413DRAFT_169275 [Trametes elegans]
MQDSTLSSFCQAIRVVDDIGPCEPRPADDFCDNRLSEDVHGYEANRSPHLLSAALSVGTRILTTSDGGASAADSNDDSDVAQPDDGGQYAFDTTPLSAYGNTWQPSMHYGLPNAYSGDLPTSQLALGDNLPTLLAPPLPQGFEAGPHYPPQHRTPAGVSDSFGVPFASHAPPYSGHPGCTIYRDPRLSDRTAPGLIYNTHATSRPLVALGHGLPAPCLPLEAYGSMTTLVPPPSFTWARQYQDSPRRPTDQLHYPFCPIPQGTYAQWYPHRIHPHLAEFVPTHYDVPSYQEPFIPSLARPADPVASAGSVAQVPLMPSEFESHCATSLQCSDLARHGGGSSELWGHPEQMFPCLDGLARPGIDLMNAVTSSGSSPTSSSHAVHSGE